MEKQCLLQKIQLIDALKCKVKFCCARNVTCPPFPSMSFGICNSAKIKNKNKQKINRRDSSITVGEQDVPLKRLWPFNIWFFNLSNYIMNTNCNTRLINCIKQDSRVHKDLSDLFLKFQCRFSQMSRFFYLEGTSSVYA